MNSIIQATMISGQVIETAKWEVKLEIPPSETHEMSLNFATQDQKIIKFLSNERMGTMVDGNKSEGFTVTVKFDIKNIKHMIDTVDLTSQSIVIIAPQNRTAEQVLVYLMNPELCNPSFIKLINS